MVSSIRRDRRETRFVLLQVGDGVGGLFVARLMSSVDVRLDRLDQLGEGGVIQPFLFVSSPQTD